MTAASFAPWEHDHAHLALRQWIYAWREENPDAPLPPLSFAAHLGGEATAMAEEDISQVEIQRIFNAYGHDGVCMCGIKPGDPLPAGEAKT